MPDLNDAGRRALGRTLVATLLVAVFAACSTKSEAARDSSASASTPMMPQTTAITPSAGPGAQVTANDGASVNKATEFKLTDDNFQRFLAAADSVVALADRDSAVAVHLSTDIAGSLAGDHDAGLQWLESNVPVSNAINSAGITAHDYYVESIAIADAEQFMNDPKAAPATPTGTENAEFLRTHTTELDHLRSLKATRPAMTIRPTP